MKGYNAKFANQNTYVHIKNKKFAIKNCNEMKQTNNKNSDGMYSFCILTERTHFFAQPV